MAPYRGRHNASRRSAAGPRWWLPGGTMPDRPLPGPPTTTCDRVRRAPHATNPPYGHCSTGAALRVHAASGRSTQWRASLHSPGVPPVIESP